ncbi:MAG: FAD-binding oxidoreductase [Acidobacteriota bacterium]
MRTQDLAGLYEGVTRICGTDYVQRRGKALDAFPGSIGEMSELLKMCDAERIPVAMEGSGSKKAWLEPGEPELYVRTARMARVLEHPWQDMTCTVEAGCCWQAMQEILAQHGQRVALDPLWPGRATVGGVVAANDSGALRLRYGGLRDLLIGMTVVLADGTIARSGGKVVKNVAGYDLPKLFCGSWGTLACIAEVTFRLHAIARQTMTITAVAESAEALGRLLLQLLDSQLNLQAMQLRTDADGFALDVRVAGTPEVLASQRDGVLATAASLAIPAECGEDDVWLRREALFHAADEAIVFKATLLPAQIASAAAAIAACGGSVVAQAHGILTGRAPAAAVGEVTAMRSKLEAEGGSLVVLRSAPDVRLERWGRLPASIPVMRALKQQFDPNGILNGGRFMGQL